MGKLYYITGCDEQIREQVYNVIWQWSQAQQAQPLQPWPLQNAESAQPLQPWPLQPNLYLYDYLAQGDGETLAQLLETYGEEMVEPIYLRSPGETEAQLMQQGIYKSYNPHTLLPLCLREIVETVFTGYRAVDYDFVGAIRQMQQEQMQQEQMQQEQMQQEQMQQARSAQAPTAHSSQAQTAHNPQPTDNQPPQPIRASRKFFLKKRMLQVLAVVAWVAFVCIVTAVIYHAVSGNGIEKKEGSLITVTLPPVNETTTNLQISAQTAGEQNAEITVGEVTFPYHKVDYALEIIPDLSRNGREYLCISYGENSGEPYYLSGMTTPNYQISKDQQVAVALLGETLWLIDEDGIRPIHEKVSEYALSADSGSCIFFVSKNKVYCYEKNGAAYPVELGEVLTEEIKTSTGTVGSITRTHEIASFLTNLDGSYCAYNCPCGMVAILNRDTLEVTELEHTPFQTLFALSEDGQWIYGTVIQGEKEMIARMSVADTTFTLLGLADEPYCCSDDGMELLCVQEVYLREADYDAMQTALYYYHANGAQAELIVLEGAEWQPTDPFNLISVDGTVYQIVHQTISEQESKISLQHLYAETDVIWENDSQVLYWSGENLVYHRGIGVAPVTILSGNPETFGKILGYTPFHELFYIDTQDWLHCFSVNSGTDSYVMDCSDMQAYCFSEEGDLYYITTEGILGWIPADWAGNGECKELYDFSQVKTGTAFFHLSEERDSAVLLCVNTKEALDYYRISEAECTYLGGYI